MTSDARRDNAQKCGKSRMSAMQVGSLPRIRFTWRSRNMTSCSNITQVMTIAKHRQKPEFQGLKQSVKNSCDVQSQRSKTSRQRKTPLPLQCTRAHYPGNTRERFEGTLSRCKSVEQRIPRVKWRIWQTPELLCCSNGMPPCTVTQR